MYIVLSNLKIKINLFNHARIFRAKFGQKRVPIFFGGHIGRARSQSEYWGAAYIMASCCHWLVVRAVKLE